MRPRQMHPDVLVAVQELLLGTGPAVHHLGHVQLIARAVRPEDRIADAGVEGMTEDLLAEDARPRRHAGDLPARDRRRSSRSPGSDTARSGLTCARIGSISALKRASRSGSSTPRR
mgnify:CR=1 FL=1